MDLTSAHLSKQGLAFFLFCWGMLGFISSGFLFRLFLEILYVSSEIFCGVNLITKQNFHRVTILRLRVKSLSRLILVNKKAGGCSWAC